MALINITPVMTSNTTPSPYVVSVSSQQVGFEGYKAFDNQNESDTNAWATANGVTTGWVQLDFSVSTKINAFSIYARNWNTSLGYDNTECPKDFILYGSDDGLTYTQIKQINNQIMWKQKEGRLFNLDFPVYYRYYRIQIISNNGKTAFTVVGEIKFYQDDGVTPTEDSKTVSRRYTLPFGSKLRLDNLTSDLTYMLATEDDGDNEGTLRIVDKNGNFALAKAGMANAEVLFDGIANTKGTTYNMEGTIDNYKYLLVIGGATNGTTNVDTLMIPTNLISSFSTTTEQFSIGFFSSTSFYYRLAIAFSSANSFTVTNSSLVGWTNIAITKIYGIK